MRSCLICDDHELVREALAGAVGGRWPDAQVARAADFNEAWALARSGPDLCLVDLMMPGAGPVEGVTGVLDIAPGTRLLVVTGSHDDALLLELLGRGVHGFVPKTSSGEVILAAIELVLAGGRYLPPRVAELAGARPAAPAASPSPEPGSRVVTDRQKQVLTLIARGLSNKEIARVLGVSPATVKTHVTNAIGSVGAANRTEAAMRARALGLI
ncbi:MAG: response regulator transcription factor [Caulobacter sp.]|nr:response regulator transcription factor [Caulobacter sp.]